AIAFPRAIGGATAGASVGKDQSLLPERASSIAKPPRSPPTAKRASPRTSGAGCVPAPKTLRQTGVKEQPGSTRIAVTPPAAAWSPSRILAPLSNSVFRPGDQLGAPTKGLGPFSTVVW